MDPQVSWKNVAKCVQKVDRSDPSQALDIFTDTAAALDTHGRIKALKLHNSEVLILLIFADHDLVPWPTSHGGSDCGRFAGRMQWIDFLDV